MYSFHYDFTSKLSARPKASIVLKRTISDEEMYSAIHDFGYVMAENVTTLKRKGVDVFTAIGDGECIVVIKWWIFPRMNREYICSMYKSPSKTKCMSEKFETFEDYMRFVRSYFNNRKLR